MNLNRSLHLEIDDNTPECVLVDLLSTCKKSVGSEYLKTRKKDIIRFLNDFKRETSVGNPEMRGMATYVSPKSQSWTPRNLWRCFLHIEDFNQDPKLRELRKFNQGEVGPKTETHPLQFDSIMIYQILQTHDLPYKPEDTIEDMMNRINHKYSEMKRESPPPKMVSPVIEPENKQQIEEMKEDLERKSGKIDKLTRHLSKLKEQLTEKETELMTQTTSFQGQDKEIERLTKELSEAKKEETPSGEDFDKDEIFDRQEYFDKLTSSIRHQSDGTLRKMRKLLEKKKPFDFNAFSQKDYATIIKSIGTYSTINKSCLNDPESVMYAFRFFSVDISSSPDPVAEIKKFCQCKLDKKKYKPVDPEFRKRYIQNKNWYNIEKTWNPKFAKFYKPESLSKVIQYNGGNEDDTVEFFEGLETFYYGIPPTSSTGMSVDGKSEDKEDNLISFFKSEDLSDEKDVICYGKEGSYIYFTPEELKGYLESEKDFNNFRDHNLQLPLHAIKKLNNICKDIKDNDDFIELGERISFFLDTGKPYFPLVKELNSNFLTFQTEFEAFFKNLYKLSLAKDEEEFKARIEKNQQLLDKLPKKMIELVGNLPILVECGDYKRLFRGDKPMMDGVKEDLFDKRGDLSKPAKFYYEGMSSDKIDE